jgi:hypothetical protein
MTGAPEACRAANSSSPTGRGHVRGGRGRAALRLRRRLSGATGRPARHRGRIRLRQHRLLGNAAAGSSSASRCPFASFNFANLRGERLRPNRPARSRPCNARACGGAISIHDKAVQSVACPSCLTVLDATTKACASCKRPWTPDAHRAAIPLGSVGRFAGQDWTVIGFQQRVRHRRRQGLPWQEYLLHHPKKAFAGWSKRGPLELGQPPGRAAALCRWPAGRHLQRTRSSSRFPPARP